MEHQQDSNRRWVSVQEAARHVGVSKFTMYRAIKKGTIPFARFGRRVLVDRPELDKLLASGGLQASTTKSREGPASTGEVS